MPQTNFGFTKSFIFHYYSMIILDEQMPQTEQQLKVIKSNI